MNLMEGSLLRLIKCSLCPQVFDSEDEFIEQRKKVHEEYHTGKQRRSDGSIRNAVIGKVEWLIIGDIRTYNLFGLVSE